jgi:hypothetical protein
MQFVSILLSTLESVRARMVQHSTGNICTALPYSDIGLLGNGVAEHCSHPLQNNRTFPY